jgi:CheY-like chemotaxis protein
MRNKTDIRYVEADAFLRRGIERLMVTAVYFTAEHERRFGFEGNGFLTSSSGRRSEKCMSNEAVLCGSSLWKEAREEDCAEVFPTLEFVCGESGERRNESADTAKEIETIIPCSESIARDRDGGDSNADLCTHGANVTSCSTTYEEKDVPADTVCLHILWADDDEEIREVFKIALESIGHCIDAVDSGEHALALLDKNQYDLLITDVSMPAGMSGWDLAEAIKGKYSTMKVAVVTGWESKISEKQKEKFGVEYFLGKPIELDELKIILEKIVRLKR